MIYRSICYLVIIQYLAIISFAWSGSISPNNELKMLIIFLFIVGTGGIILDSQLKPGIKEAVFFTSIMALCFLANYQIIGFTLYPGLVKDISIFSVQYFRISVIVFGITFIFYILCVGCSKLKQVASITSRSQRSNK